MLALLNVFLLLVRPREDPISFRWVGDNEGEPVGPLIMFEHFEGHDDMRREAHAKMRERVLHGLQANAIRYLDTEAVGAGASFSKIQPCRV